MIVGDHCYVHTPNCYFLDNRVTRIATACIEDPEADDNNAAAVDAVREISNKFPSRGSTEGRRGRTDARHTDDMTHWRRHIWHHHNEFPFIDCSLASDVLGVAGEDKQGEER